MSISTIKALNPFGEEEAVTIVIRNQEKVQPPRTADTSTQTDAKTEVDIATQTDEDEDTMVVIESVMMGESLDQSVVMAEEAVEEAVEEEASGEEEVLTEDDAFENITLRADLVEVIEISPCTAEGERFTGPEETEPEIATEPESDPNRSVTEEDEEAVSLEVQLPKVVADFMELVFSAVSESVDHVAVDEATTDDNAEEAGDMSADVALTGTTGPEADVITPEPEEERGAPSLNEEVTLVMETICEVAHEETNPENQDTSGEELPVLTETAIQVTEESAHVEVTSDDAVAPGTSDQDKPSPVTDDDPSEKCGEEEITTVQVSPSELLTTVELPEDEVKPETSPEILNAEISEESTSDVGQETVDESESCPPVVPEDDEVIPEAAIDVLAQDFAFTVTSPQEPEVDHENLVEEEVITATVFMPLSAEQGVSLTVPEEPVDETSVPPKDETVAEQLKEEAIEALSNLLEAVPESPEEETGVQGSATEEEIAGFNTSEEPEAGSNVEEAKTDVPEDVPAQTESIETPEQIPLTSEEPAEEHPSACEEDATTEVLEKTLEAVVDAVLEKLEVTEKIVDEIEDVLTQTESIETPEQILSIPEEPAEEHPSACEEDATTQMLENTLESVIEAVSELLEVTEKIVKESEDVLAQTEIIETSEQTTLTSEEPAEEDPSACEEDSITEVLEKTLEAVVEAVVDTLEVAQNVVVAPEDVLAETKSTDSSKQPPLTPEEPAEEDPSACEEDATTQMLDNTLESVIEAVSELLEVTEKIVEESEDVLAQTESIGTSEQITLISVEPAEAVLEKLEVTEENVEEPKDVAVTPVEAPEESEPSVSVQEEEEEKIVIDDEAPPAVAVLSESPAKPNVLVVILETTEDEVTEEIVHGTNNSLDVPVENSETSDEPVAECVRAVLDTIEEELIVEEATSEAVAPEDTTESTADSQSAKVRDALDLDALRERLHSACASVVEESAYRLGGLEILTQGYSITITIQVAPKTPQQ